MLSTYCKAIKHVSVRYIKREIIFHKMGEQKTRSTKGEKGMWWHFEKQSERGGETHLDNSSKAYWGHESPQPHEHHFLYVYPAIGLLLLPFFHTRSRRLPKDQHLLCNAQDLSCTRYDCADPLDWLCWVVTTISLSSFILTVWLQ